MENLATILVIDNIVPHGNADSLEIALIKNWSVIVKKGDFSIGEKICFIIPDSVLPMVEWAAFYNAKSNRVRSIRLRGVWSEGICEKLSKLGLDSNLEVGTDVTKILNIFKYEPPAPKELNARGNLPFNLFRTDENRWESLKQVPFGEKTTVTLKVDGQSFSAGCKLINNDAQTFITSRSLELKPEFNNNYTLIDKKYSITDKLKEYCLKTGQSLCIRGEIYGLGVQSFKHNPHSKTPIDFAAFSLLDLNTLQYKSFNDLRKLYSELNIPVVPVIEEGIVTKELIKKYSEDLEFINGVPFEGVVCKMPTGQSFKIINKFYDSKK